MAFYGDTVDMSLFFGTPEQKKAFCDDLLRLLKERGCVKLKNHSIPAQDIHELFNQVRTSPTFHVLLQVRWGFGLISCRPGGSSTCPTTSR